MQIFLDTVENQLLQSGEQIPVTWGADESLVAAAQRAASTLPPQLPFVGLSLDVAAAIGSGEPDRATAALAVAAIGLMRLAVVYDLPLVAAISHVLTHNNSDVGPIVNGWRAGQIPRRTSAFDSLRNQLNHKPKTDE